MSRGMHRHRSIRRANLAAHKIATKARKAPSKASARVRREARVIAKIKSTPAGTPYSAEVQSWLAVRLEKSASKITAADIKSVLA